MKSLNENKIPVWVAAISPVSRYDLQSQLDLYLKYIDQGVELITTGEISADWDNNYMEGPAIRIRTKRAKKNFEALSVFGPPSYNFLTAHQGVELVRNFKLKSDKCIIANIGDNGADKQSRHKLIKELIDAGVDGFEIAMSCPNIFHGEKNSPIEWLNNSLQYIEQVKAITSLPVSVKIGMIHLNLGHEYIVKQFYDRGIRQIALTDAILSMWPPEFNDVIEPPFNKFQGLSFVGVSGPWCRYLLYGGIASLKITIKKLQLDDMKISAVGGIFKAKHGIELFTLGADSIQLSSLVLLKGYNEIGKFITKLQEYTENKNITKQINNIPIFMNAQNALETLYGKNFIKAWMDSNPVSKTNSNCNNCKICCTTPCLARVIKNAKPITVENLCSGCGLCAELCVRGGITMQERRENK